MSQIFLAVYGDDIPGFGNRNGFQNVIMMAAR
jgi:hypothetical protein